MTQLKDIVEYRIVSLADEVTIQEKCKTEEGIKLLGNDWRYLCTVKCGKKLTIKEAERDAYGIISILERARV